MITKKTIKNGFEKGVISIEDDYAGCLGACCRIGDNAFYFIDAAEENGIDYAELAYYEAVLTTNFFL